LQLGLGFELVIGNNSFTHAFASSSFFAMANLRCGGAKVLKVQ